ncbi:hypothetical protein [Streptomyces sp. NPDC047000]|uniref:hypothetical protein n=1 Tax=Streptomyces sp. NPDC047000 TaxID=3155474 RepID=UPI00340472F5
MTAVPAVLLAAAVAVGVTPGFAGLVGHGVSAAVTRKPPPAPHRTPPGILLGVLSTALAAGLALLAVTRPRRASAPDRTRPLRRLQSGHVGDYVAWLLLGVRPAGGPGPARPAGRLTHRWPVRDAVSARAVSAPASGVRGGSRPGGPDGGRQRGGYGKDVERSCASRS